MKYILSVLSSTRSMAILLFAFASSIAIATFVEKNAGTEAAQALIYHAKWFEFLLLLGVVNIIAVTFKRKLYQKGKLTVLLFHLSFIVIITGAAFTRYLGKEGIMPVREGQTTSRWYSAQNYINILLTTRENKKSDSYPILLSSRTNMRFRHNYRIDGHRVKIKIRQYLPQAEKNMVPDPEGSPYIHLLSSVNSERKDFYLTPGDMVMIGNNTFTFVPSNDKNATDRITIFENERGALSFSAPFDVSQTSMETLPADILTAGEVHDLIPMLVYDFQGILVLVMQYQPKGIIAAVPSENQENQLPSAMILDVKCDNISRSMTVWEQETNMDKPAVMEIDGLKVLVSYGSRLEVLPFSLTLDDFILKRYPGSESPSWYESDVLLTDPERNISRKHRIYMNHILKYRGYRFYQSSYDADEKGTVLSLNRDSLGTSVTYAGYILLALGIVTSLLNRNSRFRSLIKKPSETNRILLLMIAGLLFSLSSSYAWGASDSMKNNLPVVDKDHAREFGRMLVQVNNGRIVPMNTMSSEILRKVARKETYKGQFPDQVMLGMLAYPVFWQHEPVIRVSSPGLREILGTHSGYASFIDFFSRDGNYLLKPYVDEAYRKSPANRSKFDNEVMRTDERLNICYLVFTREVLKVFPGPGSTTHKWYSPVTVSGVFSSEDTVFTSHIMDYYFEEVVRSMQSRDWKTPGEILKAIYTFQKKYDAAIMPSMQHAKTETLYNQLNLFNRLIKPYMLAGILLLLIQFVHIFIPRFSIRYFSKAAVVFVSTAFAFHTLGLALRWYVSGHAPISNGYETLSFVAWAAVLAGLLLSCKSSITVSTTSILAALVLQVAHLSWMDPQITNLVPVLRSYWLVIHVAVVTASYGFLGMGTLLAVINLILMFFESGKNHERMEIQISQITQIIEVTLIAGLYLLTTGSFLGGVWANESWGRYWGWDPKETWALVTIIVYAFILHMRMIPGMKGRVLFNIAALAGFSSVLMTYFGVNYYLSGLHSYAGGNPMPVPPLVYYSVITVIVLIILSSAKQSYLKKKGVIRGQTE
ncbi:MAG: c-type cytochrome biogenesis protein CcsB [Bacteroidetes bacterium RBG_13_46_8]|nr:MAG: c-type cytochrome biogenesis protein CcsB [Bacteroidetes bacterium RBG_13_46_8]